MKLETRRTFKLVRNSWWHTNQAGSRIRGPLCFSARAKFWSSSIMFAGKKIKPSPSVQSSNCNSWNEVTTWKLTSVSCQPCWFRRSDIELRRSNPMIWIEVNSENRWTAVIHPDRLLFRTARLTQFLVLPRILLRLLGLTVCSVAITAFIFRRIDVQHRTTWPA